MTKKRLIAPALTGLLVLAVAGCASPEEAPAPAETTIAPETSAPSPSPIETHKTTAGDAHTAAELAAVLDSSGFDSDAYPTTQAMLDGIYAGTTAKDDCLKPFGIGWEDDPALADAAQAFGPSIDKSMTVTIASTGDPDAAADLVASLSETVATCGAMPDAYTFSGMSVALTVEEYDAGVTGADEAAGWKAAATIAGHELTMLGTVTRVGGDVIALVGWNPATNTEYVPMATQALVDALP